jgi:outer membrane lipoprotein-sorting protein
MSKVMRIILALSLALSLSFAIIGCADEEAAQGELTQEKVEQIVADAAVATEGVKTFKFDMDMQMAMDMIAEGESGQISIVADYSGSMDQADNEMQMLMDIKMDFDVPDGTEQMGMDMDMEVYIVGDWMYMKMGMLGLGEEWMKMVLTDEVWQEQSQISQFGEQIELLASATEVSLLGSEDVNGTACYVVEIVPEMGALGNLLSQLQTLGMEGLDFGQLNLADLFKEVSIKEWIAKDSYLLTKSEIYMLMEISAGDVGATEDDFGKMTMDVNMVMKLYDYNQEVSIELPEAALQAEEMPGLGL